MSNNTTTMLAGKAEKWKVTLIDTGQDTMTGGRLKRIAAHLDDDDFCMTYGDAVTPWMSARRSRFIGPTASSQL